MSGNVPCRCVTRQKLPTTWRVVQYRENRSAFNGCRPTPSEYSEVQCTLCRGRWRTKAAYVEKLSR